MNIEDLRKEYGEDVYSYRQEYAGAKMEKDGYSDEYVHFLEQKLTSDNIDYAKCKQCDFWKSSEYKKCQDCGKHFV